MAAFSYQHHPFLDAFLPNTNIKMSGFEEACFSYYQSGIAAHHISAGDKIPENMGFDNSRKIVAHEDQVGRIEEGELVRKCRNGVDLKGKQELDSSLVELGAADQVIQQSLMEKKRKNCNEYQLNSTQSKETKEGKRKKAKGYSSLKETEEEKLKADKKRQGKLCEEPPSGFIHVRARRGQATDSHSLAERVRREKISERMKLLQGLVPGCDKVTGKALMLDEIINYVQSLQNQVEFLSMKLACVNPMFYDFGLGFEDYMMNPELQKSRSLTPPIPSLQQPSQTQLTSEYQQVVTFVNPPAIPTTNNYPLLDTSLSVLLDDQKPNAFSQDNGNLCWNAENQKQRFIDQDCFYKVGLFQ